jgi:hypothetical protein
MQPPFKFLEKTPTWVIVLLAVIVTVGIMWLKFTGGLEITQ